MMFEDANIGLILVVILPILLWFYFQKRRKSHGALLYPETESLSSIATAKPYRARHFLFFLRLLVIILVVFALMRPQKGIENTKIETEGIDIVLALDVSGSMRAEDFILNGKRYNRLHVVKEVVKDFIKKRKNDRIGLVVFAGRAYTQCPLTLDYGVLLQFLDKIKIGMIEDGTAIGDGVASSLNRLRKQESKSKLVILLTDGINNAGKVDPVNAAEMAKAIDIKMYTIGVGGKGRVPFPVKDIFGNKVYQWAQIQLDDESLKNLAEITGGQYFHAKDTKALKKVYNEIDKLEKTKIESNLYQEYKELFVYFLFGALLLLLFEQVLGQTRFRTVP